MNLLPTTLLAPLDQLPEGELVEREVSLHGELESVLLLRRGEQVQAWLNLCPHAGRRLDYAPGQFLISAGGELVCPVHGATFELQAGTCTAGPCRGQSLRSLAVQLVQGQVLLAA
ncbi:MAG: Rieske (2Fe-2S) protein [Stenotrophomonas sp.]|mgnify:CR=1 FL=1